MRRLCAPILACLILAGVGAQFAHAEELPIAQQPYNDPLKKTVYATLVKNNDLQTLYTNATPEQIAQLKASGLLNPDGTKHATRWRTVARNYYRMAMKMKLAPALHVLGVIGVFADAVKYEWRFAHSTWNPGGYIYKAITGESYGGTITTGAEWTWTTSGDYYDLHAPTGAAKWVLYRQSSNPDHCVPQNFSGCTVPEWFSLLAIAHSGSSTLETTNSCGSGVAANCYAKHRSEDQMTAALDIEDSTSGAHAASGNQKNTSAFTAPTTVPDSDIQLGRDVLDNANKDTRDVINTFIDSDYEVDASEGSLGTVTNPTHVQPPATTVPPATGIDFTPITELDGECSFPFGFICYAQDVTAAFDVTADAPRFELDVAVPSLAGGGTIDYDVDLNVMDDYMTIIRTLISFVLWVGAVYFLAVNLLGFRAGGDPGEAADEAIHV